MGWALIDRWLELFPSPRDESAPFLLSDEQALTVVAWYSVHPVSGHFVFRRGASRRSKVRGVGRVGGAGWPSVGDAW